MFSFFRRYQRAIFFVITVVIILSFSFFGTYSSIDTGGEDPVLFTSVNGSKIRRMEFNDYIRFLSADSHLGGEGEFFNPLNDGVFALDIIQSGVGETLADRFSDQFSKEWIAKNLREKVYAPYQHPSAPFVSALQIWNYFAPDIARSLEQYKALESSDCTEIFRKKAELYLAERTFPALYLRQVLAYQQKQFQWLEPDPALDAKPLALFGYNQISEWFGIDFVEKACEFIIQTAAKARSSGLKVSQAEALASLYKNVKGAAKSMGESEDPEELFTKTLRQLHMDRAQAAKIWADVMLFRRVLSELPNRVVLSKGPFDEYLSHQSQMSELSCFQLQSCLRFGSLRDVMKFEVWKSAVSTTSSPLDLPSDFHEPSKVLVSWPELVERPFILKVSSTSNAELAKKIRVRDLWKWEVDNWETLAEEFSQLKEKQVENREEKFALLDQISPQIRSNVDEKAKAAIVEAHPEWRSEALDKAQEKRVRLSFRARGGAFPFEGITDRPAFLQALLDEEGLSSYTQDNDHVYRIEVVEKSDSEQIVSFPDALEDGTLDSLLDRLLEPTYARVKDDYIEFRDEKGVYKPFSEAKDQVGEIHFATLLAELDQIAQEWKEKLPNYCPWEEKKAARVAVYFLPHLSALQEQLKASEDSVITTPFEASPEDTAELIERPLSDLWSLVKESQEVVYHERESKPQFSHLLDKEEGFWGLARYSRELGPFVAKVEKRGVEPYDQQLRSTIYSCQEVLGTELIREKSGQLVFELFGEK